MAAGLRKRFAFARRRSQLRKVVTWVSVFVFLLVGFAHSVHDFNSSPSAPPSSQSNSVLQKSIADSAKHAAAMTVHCDACEIVLMTVQSYAAADAAPVFEVPVARFGSFRPHVPAAETPPPITML